jgi:hypothetical protein
MVMNIQEYSESVRKHIKKKYPFPTDYNWRQAYDDKKYPSVLLGYEGHKNWADVHRWCEEHIGKEHYTWTGSRFWFDNIDNATLFALKWS